MRSKGLFTVFLDCDGVIYDFFKFFNRILAAEGIPIHDSYIPSKYDYSDVIPNFMKYFGSLPNNWPDTMELFPGVLDRLNTLEAMGANIVLVTSMRQANTPHRLTALVRHGVPFHSAMFTESHNKADFIGAVLPNSPGPKYFVDDLYTNCIPVKNRFKDVQTVTISYPYNVPNDEKQISGIEAVKTSLAALDWVINDAKTKLTTSLVGSGSVDLTGGNVDLRASRAV